MSNLSDFEKLEKAREEIASLADADSNFEAACADLRKAIRKAYPVGATVAVTLGANRIVGRVTGASHDWSLNSIQDVYVENVKTGKLRRFSALHPDIYKPTLLSLP